MHWVLCAQLLIFDVPNASNNLRLKLVGRLWNNSFCWDLTQPARILRTDEPKWFEHMTILGNDSYCWHIITVNACCASSIAEYRQNLIDPFQWILLNIKNPPFSVSQCFRFIFILPLSVCVYLGQPWIMLTLPGCRHVIRLEIKFFPEVVPVTIYTTTEGFKNSYFCFVTCERS